MLDEKLTNLFKGHVNDFKKLNIEQFGTRYIRRKTRATSLEEERIRKLVNAGDLNYLIQLGNSPDYHEMVEC